LKPFFLILVLFLNAFFPSCIPVALAEDAVLPRPSEVELLNQLGQIIRFVSKPEKISAVVPEGEKNLEFEPLKPGAAELIFASPSEPKRLNIEVIPGLNYFMLPTVNLAKAGEVETIQIGLSGTFNVIVPHPQYQLTEVSEKLSTGELTDGELKLVKENTQKILPFVGSNPNPEHPGVFDLLFSALDREGTMTFTFDYIPACRWAPQPCSQPGAKKVLTIEIVSTPAAEDLPGVDLRKFPDTEMRVQLTAGKDLHLLIPRPEYRFVRIDEKMKGELTPERGLQVAWDLLSKSMPLSQDDKSNIKIQLFEKVKWSKAQCLDWEAPGQTCEGGELPEGFRLIIDLHGNIYEFRGDTAHPDRNRLDPSKSAALVAMKDLVAKGSDFATMKIGKAHAREENQTLVYDIEILIPDKKWKYTVDPAKKSVVFFTQVFPDNRTQTFDPEGNLIREVKSDGSYLELNWDPMYRLAVLHDPKGNSFAYHGLHYSETPEASLKEYTLLTTDLFAVPARFVSGRFFETTIEGVRSLHLHRHGIDIIFDKKNPNVISNLIVGYEDILGLMALAQEAFKGEENDKLKVIEARIQSFFEKVIQQIQEPEPVFPPETISVSQVQAFQHLIQERFKGWFEEAFAVPAVKDLTLVVITDTFVQFLAELEHVDPAKHRIVISYRERGASGPQDLGGSALSPDPEAWKTVELDPPNIMGSSLRGFLMELHPETFYEMKVVLLDRKDSRMLSETGPVDFTTTNTNENKIEEIKTQGKNIVESLVNHYTFLVKRIKNLRKTLPTVAADLPKEPEMAKQVTQMAEEVQSLLGNNADAISRGILARTHELAAETKGAPEKPLTESKTLLNNLTQRLDEALEEIESLNRSLQDPNTVQSEIGKDLLMGLKALEGKFIAASGQIDDLEKEIKTKEEDQKKFQEAAASVFPMLKELLKEAKRVSEATRLVKSELGKRLGISPADLKVTRIEERDWGYTMELEYQEATFFYQVDKVGNVAFDIWTTSDALVQLALQDLVKRLGPEALGIEVKSADLVVWPNSCLGLRMPGGCREAKTAGYRFLFTVRGTKQYEYHTDLYKNIGLLSDKVSMLDESIPVNFLASALGLSEKDKAGIRIIAFEETLWPNGCLGFDLPRQGCADISFPNGYKLIMEIFKNWFELHGVSDSPDNFRLDPAKDAAIIALNDLVSKGVSLSAIKIDSSVLRYENDTIFFDVKLSSQDRKWSYTVDYWKKSILTPQTSKVS